MATRVILCFVCISSILALTAMAATNMTTHTPRVTQNSNQTNPTKEPSEHVSFRIIYEYHTHTLVIVRAHDCFVFELSDSERVAVHTDAGMRAIEMKCLSALGTDALIPVQKSELPAKAAHVCGHNIKAYYKATVA